ncbi:MAG TPA: right-handed parallel beta-helix repeat-containing protein [Jatrophihabitans sp.]|nr:right-handed parallel beta-helix repeat-containing protein [Jatrophihabitans sp.]
MRRNLLTALYSVAGLTLAAWTVPTAAHASPASTHVKCGQTLTSSIRLANSLSGCPGDGLVIGADNITVDLAGHSIRGVNAAGSEGIADDGHPGVRIRNGTIATFFLNGVGLRGAPRSEVSDMRIREIGAGGVENEVSAGVLVKNSANTLVFASTVTNHVSAFQSDGVDVLSSAGTMVIGNRIANNAWDGMVVIGSPGTRVIGNALSGNKNQGIEVNLGSDRSLLAGNYARNNVSSGLVVGAVSRTRIEANILTGNGESGLFMFDLMNSRVSGNRASSNGVGIDLEGGQHGSSGNRLAHNDTSHNVHAGLEVASGANDNLVVGNVANANRGGPDDGGGIVLFAVTGNTARGNVANQNRDVGIGVLEDQPGDSTGNVLTANTANSNRNHGISAVAGTVDGGGNMAHHNTPPPDCIGVVCT